MIVNCTPHAIVLRYNLAGLDTEVTFPPSGTVPRLKVETVVDPIISLKAGYPVVKSITGEVEGLPDALPGIFLLTSTMVAQASKRWDVIAPDTGPTAIRENGQVVAVTRFQAF